MWKYTGGAGGSDFIPGVPADDLTDEQMDELENTNPGLKKNGLWKHVSPEPATPASPKATKGGPE